MAESIRPLTKNDRQQFVTVMTKVFAKDPLFLYIFGDLYNDHRAQRRARTFMGFIFDKSMERQAEAVWGLFDKDTLLGTYVVESCPAETNHSFAELYRLMILIFRLSLQLPPKMTWQLNRYMRVTRAHAPSIPHHYLTIIGVRKEAQGAGRGRNLLEHIFGTIGSGELSLDTEKKENVTLYKKFGFVLTDVVKCGPINVYCMRKTIRPRQKN
ncbi:BH3330 [Halalkalibacterium halodurans C-125]|uniref:BH3330 protein n=1 Tax=Halalkalibacterium halodurans (strain ATCC BAA-125 / DSM 18197 / FERM 7344 / JCM 9153 / C-125) TaxID=272558 RepID=Q9K7N1_HALH5|nr:GNAT family N-acetyltransferase [Halalkalibacterium halodurans]BAB07049.1 BH3330 [Halalkalibacterium halodurans C-125]